MLLIFFLFFLLLFLSISLLSPFLVIVQAIAPLPIIVSPPSLSLNTGAELGYFAVSTNGSLYTGDANSIGFVLSGLDAGLYALDGATVSVTIDLGIDPLSHHSRIGF
jgi:hypothetical protein